VVLWRHPEAQDGSSVRGWRRRMQSPSERTSSKGRRRRKRKKGQQQQQQQWRPQGWGRIKVSVGRRGRLRRSTKSSKRRTRKKTCMRRRPRRSARGSKGRSKRRRRARMRRASPSRPRRGQQLLPKLMGQQTGSRSKECSQRVKEAEATRKAAKRSPTVRMSTRG